MAELHTTHPRGGLYFKVFEVGRVFCRRLFRRRASKQDGTLVAECRGTAFIRRRPPATTTV